MKDHNVDKERANRDPLNAEDQLAERYDAVRGESRLDWERAKDAARAGWYRLDAAPTRRD